MELRQYQIHMMRDFERLVGRGERKNSHRCAHRQRQDRHRLRDHPWRRQARARGRA